MSLDRTPHLTGDFDCNNLPIGLPIFLPKVTIYYALHQIKSGGHDIANSAESGVKHKQSIKYY